MIYKLSGHIVLYKILISTEKFKHNDCDHIDFTKYPSEIAVIVKILQNNTCVQYSILHA